MPGETEERMNEIKKAQKALQRISAALEFCEYQDNAPIWAFVEDVAEVLNGVAPDLLEALEEANACLENLDKLLMWNKSEGDHIDEAYAAMCTSRIAIAKAKGGAQ